MLKALAYIFGFLLLGELITYFFEIPIAGNILGMFLIFIALRLKLIKLQDVKPASDKLIKYLVLFFIPYGVGLMVYFEIIADYWMPISVAVIASTVITLYISAIIIEKLEK
ncbi:CidA/LrgA family protein [Salegentibacter mishustinae]|jgi:holin-like protein|uniref:Murein hydrolase transporter LrgA n=1 Tax=Salegentibacter mishustinae TaxID=270918 RepID=A0A0Q9Z8V3_9FLAO|nr:CidA/LrgA family protein [Salegentibacter mishustinae]KRG28473.1 murein hydrolase transporter LrgA [Salegentibacter mishustinae]MDX1720429.1 CidA/LrgA family protein [Salegentibacter mishustinae]PNW22407.1 murein hydrolase transporter LrgA [Salegentibacter mishustinae]PZX67642.1 holin-like protein [Salegentibacter mishustinae]UBZ07496.1 CidA/LrgA family protein [Salegentibacter mishustinae]|tara:strand:- start:151 stop:483 length:333 start_codon:yes stop_codon:yes gene_type:complete